MRTTASRYLADVDLPDDLKVKMGEQCMKFHSSIRNMTIRYKEEAKRYAKLAWDDDIALV